MAATKAVSEAFHVDKETDEVMGETSDEVDPQQAILCLESILIIIYFFFWNSVQNQMNEPACEPSLKNLNRKRHCGFLNKKYLHKKALWKEVSNFYIKAKKLQKVLN